MADCPDLPKNPRVVAVSENTGDVLAARSVSFIIKLKYKQWATYIFPARPATPISKVLQKWDNMITPEMRTCAVSHMASCCSTDNNTYIDAMYSKLTRTGQLPRSIERDMRKMYNNSNTAPRKQLYSQPHKHIVCYTRPDTTAVDENWTILHRLSVPDILGIWAQLAHAYGLFDNAGYFNADLLDRHTHLVRHTFPHKYIIEPNTDRAYSFYTYYGIFIRVFDLPQNRADSRSSQRNERQHKCSPEYIAYMQYLFRDANYSGTTDIMPLQYIVDMHRKCTGDIHAGNVVIPLNILPRPPQIPSPPDPSSTIRPSPPDRESTIRPRQRDPHTFPQAQPGQMTTRPQPPQPPVQSRISQHDQVSIHSQGMHSTRPGAMPTQRRGMPVVPMQMPRLMHVQPEQTPLTSHRPVVPMPRLLHVQPKQTPLTPPRPVAVPIQPPSTRYQQTHVIQNTDPPLARSNQDSASRTAMDLKDRHIQNLRQYIQHNSNATCHHIRGHLVEIINSIYNADYA